VRHAHPRSAAETKFRTRASNTPDAIRHSGASNWYNNGMSSCQDCSLDVDHCHGTLVVHSDRALECTDAACELPDLLRHSFVVDCVAVLGGCCVAEEPGELAAAS
jgi:hypothetical protein